MMKRYLLPMLLVVLMVAACGPTAVSTPAPAATSAPETAVTPADAYPAQPEAPAAYPADREAVKEDPVAYPGQDLQDVTPTPLEEVEMDETPPPAEEPAADVPAAVYEMRIVQDMIQDLSQREEIAPETISVVSFEEVTWRDSSLGCPRPGMQYLQVLTEGFKVVLAAEGEQYDYHATSGRFVFCP